MNLSVICKVYSMVKRGIVYLVLLFSFLETKAVSDTALISKDGVEQFVWQFTTDDDSLFVTNTYEGKTIPTNLSIFGTKDSLFPYLRDIGWFRTWIRADEKVINKSLCLAFVGFGKLNVYLDGSLLSIIGRTEDKKLGDQLVFFYLTDTLPHILAIRYENSKSLYKKTSFAQWGFILEIEEATSMFQQKVASVQTLSVVILPIATVFATLFVIHLLMFFFYRKDVSNLYFALFNLGGAICLYGLYVGASSDVNVEHSRTPTMIITASSILACYSICAFCAHLFIKRKWYLWVVGALSLVLALVTIFFYEIETQVYIENGLGLLGIVTSVYVVVVFIYAMLKKVPGSRILGGGILFTIFFIFSVIMAAVLTGGDMTTTNSILAAIIIIAGIFAVFSIPLSISSFLAWRYAYTNKNLQLQLENVAALSEKTLQQEKEKQHILENQKAELEKEVAVRTQEIIEEKQKSDNLLLNILPQEIAEELKLKGESKAQHFDMASVLFTDFVNFTTIAGKMTAEELLQELNVNFTAFDHIIEKYGLEKIKTIGDAYLAVSGIPVKDDNHAQHAIQAAMEIVEYMKQRKTRFPDGFDIRIGINSGPLVAGIIGVKKFAYDIWGDTVNIAARMEQNSEPGKINISENTYQLVKDEFTCEHRGKITAKGKGELDMYFVKSKNAQFT